MANDPTKIRLGPCRVRWGGRELGLTKGGVEIELKTDTKMVQVDQFGTTPVDEVITGRTLSIKVPFAESDIDSIYAMLRASATSMVDTGVKATGTLTLSVQVTAADTLTVNGHIFTYQAAGTVVGPGGTTANTIQIGATTAATLVNTLAILQASSNPLVQKCTFALTSATVITATAVSSGTAGNAITLAKTGTNMTVSAATLTGGTAASKRRVEMLTGIGVSLQSTALELLLHPQANADNDYSEDFVVPLANTSGSFSFAYKLNEERVMNLTYTAYPDPVTTVLFKYGNPY